MPDLSLITRAQQHRDRTAIVDRAGEYSYGQLLEASARVAGALSCAGQSEKRSDTDLHEQRVAYLIEPGFPWAAVQWGIWRAGGIAVPLPLGSPATELAYLLDDTRAAMMVADESGMEMLAPLATARRIPLLRCDQLLRAGLRGSEAAHETALPVIEQARRAMILYTSGTTSRPKGVVTTHANIEAQVTTLVRAWQWSQDDRILLCLPLHHVHGIINVLSCALWSGAACEMMPRFDATAVWDRIARGGVTLFMAVPTIYTRLIAAWEAASPERQARLSEACQRLRLMISGSAALPVSTLERWKQISGHTLLERYGMTEIGMALSNPLAGPRVAGTVGVPLPGVEVRLADERGEAVEAGTPGEIEARGPSVFKEYWGKPEATREAFRQGWFRTGDFAVVEDGRYRILGRLSIDILKTGGHKVSALEIEEQLREHPAIAECAVVGLADPEWGERVAAAVVLRPAATLSLDGLRAWAKQRLAGYKVPSRLLVIEALPRNAMGKVTKPAVVELFHSAGQHG